MRDRVVMCYKQQFNLCLLFIWLSNIKPKPTRQPGVNFCLLFIWLSNTTPELSHQLGVIGTHVTCEISRRLHVERFLGRFLKFNRSNPSSCSGEILQAKGTRHSNRLVFSFSSLCIAASLSCRLSSVMQQIKR
jgi:hypothetical protein